MSDMKGSTFGFQCVRVVALAATDAARANRFYGETLALPPAIEHGEHLGYFLGDTILMPKVDWYGAPTTEPNPRITIRVDDAARTEAAFLAHGIRISDPVEVGDGYKLGSFLDSEGNKLWFCSVG
jgi:catechol 2,3-dioxygenase-like lactoylglutathione lyase family enzyme